VLSAASCGVLLFSAIERGRAAMQPELLDRDEVCRFFGGTKPIDAATLVVFASVDIPSR